MSYKINRAVGYQPWGVTNPWVWADLSQPQRKRGQVSPMVFQTYGPYLKSAHLGQTPEERLAADLKRSERMEKIAIAGLVISASSLLFMWSRFGRKKPVTANRRRPRRRRRRRRR